MYLKRVDIQGFKSFPEKIKLDFKKGITGVVGPNGSGKSNISDACRWALGEQSAKSLRGEKMEDIIFSGTQNRKPLGFAEVTMTIDNTDGENKLTVPFSEVNITRRVYRSGESEYLINGTTCRLKDIHDLFMDTGIGREGYSIIGQGKIDEILSTKTEDRRHIFEEAAGIVKYKARRKEAFSKLEKETENLIRVNDIITELGTRIAPLAEDSQKAKEYLDLKEKLKDSQIVLFAYDYKKIEQGLLALIDNISNIDSETALNEKEQKNVELELHNIKENREQLEEEVEKANSNYHELLSEEERNESEGKLLLERIASKKRMLSDLENDNTYKEEEIAKNSEEINNLTKMLNDINISYEKEQDNFNKTTEQYEKIISKIESKEEVIENLKGDLIENIKITSEYKGKIEREQEKLEQFDIREKQLHEEQLAIADMVIKKQSERARCAETLDENRHLEQQTLNSIKNLENEKELLKQQNIAKTSQLNKVNSSYNQLKTKLNMLLEMEKDHEGFQKSVKAILKLNDENKINGVKGAVGELLSVPKQFETAILAALGGSIQNIVVENENAAKAAIEYLKAERLGQATFLPLTTIKPKKGIENDDSLLKKSGVIGVCKNLISYDKMYENVFDALLGRVIVVDKMDTAIRLSRETGYKFRIVTLEGEIFNPGGSITGGGLFQKATNIFGRTREIKDLKEKINSEKEAIALLQTELLNDDNRLNEISKETKEAYGKYDYYKIEIVSNSKILEQLNIEIVNLSEKEKQIDLEIEQLFFYKKNLQDNITEFYKVLENAEKTIVETESYLSQKQGSFIKEKDEKEQLTVALTQIQVALTELSQQKIRYEENIERLSYSTISIQKVIEDNKAKMIDLSNAITKKQDEIISLKDLNEGIKKKQILAKEHIQKLSENKKCLNEKEEALYVKNKEFSDILLKLNKEKFRLENKLENIRNDKDRLLTEMDEEYALTVCDIENVDLSKIKISEKQREERYLKESIKNLGNVNINAIEEYKAVKERYNFLVNQRDDIIDAEIKLKKIIEDLTEQMEIQFKSQLKVISENFSTVFHEMFGGGTAYVKLVNENSVLDCDIEIIAKPPGKSLQNMMLLSGGERALTAISLLFGILKMKPSPFCILDEIEAALDDANVNRFANYLKKFSQKTQFIVVTHRKGTMAVADVLYGVTMQEMGVSKLLSVALET